jgi:RNA polymerase sigma-70 factor (ECF subfamily)
MGRTERNRQDFDETVLTHLDELYGTAVRLARSKSDAEDLVQEAVMRAWTFWDRFEPGTNARAWMHRILMNTFINGYRRKKRERTMLALAWIEAHTRPRTIHEARRAKHEGLGDEVEAALAALPEEFRTVVLLVDHNDLTYKEVAEALDCPIGTVMSRLHRARRLLKQRLRTYAVTQGYIAEAA